MKKSIILLLSVLFISSCQFLKKEKVVTVEDKYSISLPGFLVEAGITLNEEASLEYMNAFMEFYVMVIDEPKSSIEKVLIDYELADLYPNNLKGYSELILDGLKQAVIVSQESDVVDTVINGLPARLLTINGTVEGIDIFYSLAYIEGKERYYQIFTWTLSEKETEYRDKMSKILYSFKEL